MNPPAPRENDGLSLRRHWPFAALGVLALVGYSVVAGRYYIHFMDDAWVMAWAYNWLHHGAQTDNVFRDGSYVLVFGKLMWLVYGGALELFGWSKANALHVSTALIFATGACWYGIARRLGWSATTGLTLAATIVLLDKIVEAGALCRPEAMVLLWISGALLAFAHERYLLAGLLAVAGAETHPMALTSLFYILAWTLTHHRKYRENPANTARKVGWFALGGALGVAVYVGLHWDALQSGQVAKVLAGSDKFAGAARSEWTYLDRHFQWHSQLELLIFVFALFAWLQQKAWRDCAFPLLVVVCVVVSAFGSSRPNGFYAALAFPAFAVLCVAAFEKAGIARAALALLAVSFVFETHARWAKHPEFQPQSGLAEIAAAVPADGLPVAGMNDFWFLFPDRPFLPGDYHGDVAARLDSEEWSDLYLIDSTFMSNRRTFGQIKSHLRRHFVSEVIASTKEHGKHPLKILRYRRKTRR